MNDARFIELALANNVNREIMKRLPELALPDAWLVSGCLFQTVWNGLTGRDPEYGIRDYDIFYFDPDTSWDAEDRVIRKAREVFAGIGADIELKNQARVHLWYREKFGADYPPLGKSTDGIDRFLAPVCMLGLHENTRNLTVYARHGYADLEALIVRPHVTGNFTKAAYDAKTARWKAMWPEVTIINC
jgi:hypothetical protein